MKFLRVILLHTAKLTHIESEQNVIKNTGNQPIMLLRLHVLACATQRQWQCDICIHYDVSLFQRIVELSRHNTLLQ